MTDNEPQKESLLRKANIAARLLRSNAIEKAIALVKFADSMPHQPDSAAEEILNKAAEDAKSLLSEAAVEAKLLISIAAELGETNRKTALARTKTDAKEMKALLARAVELVDTRRESLLIKANIAAELLRSRALEDATALVNLENSMPHVSDGADKEILNKAVEQAKSLLSAATEEALELLAIAAETAESLLLKEHISAEALIRAEQLESVGLLAGGIAHDFNNILTSVLGNLELAKYNLPHDHIAYRHIQTANQAMDKATKLTNQLLTLAKGGEPLLEIVDVKELIQESIKFTSSSNGSINIILTLQQDLWLINADKGQLSQVLINLLINARQAMPNGGTLTIKAINAEEYSKFSILNHAGEFIRLVISDDGVGISEEQQKYIFNPYFTTKQSGSGLGLATVNSIIAKHKGYISVKSELGNGTTFNIFLPANPDAQIVDKALLDDKVNPIVNSGNILALDDNKMILDTLTRMLETLGYAVTTALHGEQAIEKYIDAEKCGRPFDAVIMDLTIPGGMGGEGAIKALLEVNPNVKVIVSSGYCADQIMSNYTEYGFKGRLVKPYRMASLEQEMSKMLNIK